MYLFDKQLNKNKQGISHVCRNLKITLNYFEKNKCIYQQLMENNTFLIMKVMKLLDFIYRYLFHCLDFFVLASPKCVILCMTKRKNEFFSKMLNRVPKFCFERK